MLATIACSRNRVHKESLVNLLYIEHMDEMIKERTNEIPRSYPSFHGQTGYLEVCSKLNNQALDLCWYKIVDS